MIKKSPFSSIAEQLRTIGMAPTTTIFDWKTVAVTTVHTKIFDELKVLGLMTHEVATFRAGAEFCSMVQKLGSATQENFHSELGTRQHCRDNVTMFSSQKTVDYCIIASFNGATLF